MSAREIKFRAYNHDSKAMLEVRAIDFSHEGGVLSINYPNGKVYPNKDFGDHITLMQYTGLKDKNGVEIYEGDLLDIQAAGGDRGYVPVVFKDGAFMMHIDYWVTEYYHLSDYDGSLYKVIGNIWENGDLLSIGFDDEVVS